MAAGWKADLLTRLPRPAGSDRSPDGEQGTGVDVGGGEGPGTCEWAEDSPDCRLGTLLTHDFLLWASS